MTLNLAVIPARSGSKGLPGKNIRLLAGKPLLAHTVLAAKQSGLFDEIYLSTDSAEYARIGIEYGVSVPFLRSPELATDSADSLCVVRDALRKYRVAGREFHTVALLQPTSPLRTAQDIVGAYQLFASKNARTVVALCQADHSPLLCNHLPKDGSLDCFLNPNASCPRQKQGIFYRINGAIYIARTPFIETTNNLYQAGCYGYVMPKERSVDIDDEIDFFIAQALIHREAITDIFLKQD